MRDAFIDVVIEVPRDDLRSHGDNAPQWVLERMRGKADEVCAENGARLRTDLAPEFIIEDAEQKFTGVEYVLMATRWAVVVPESVQV